MRKNHEKPLVGHVLCPGIAIGPLVFFKEKISVNHEETDYQDSCPISSKKEIARYRKALEQSCLDLQQLREGLAMKGVMEGAAILEAQEQMLRDPLLTQLVETEIELQKQRAETLFSATIQQLEERFRQSIAPTCDDAYTDLEDVASRVLRYLRNAKEPKWDQLPKGAVIYAKELSPSQTIEALESSPAAFLTERGGPMSHSAIVARAAGIPYITHLPENSFSEKESGHCVIVDATCGEVITAAPPSLYRDYQEKQKRWADQQLSLHAGESTPAYTQDGHLIRLSVNMEVDSDPAFLHTHGSSGIGLLRSEHLISGLNRLPSEAEQFIYYRQMVKQMRGLPVVIRVFDIDEAQATQSEQKQNTLHSQLGWRAIRFLLRETQIFHTQLRAILRASAYGNVGIMFPLISGLQELREAKQQLQRVQQELASEGIAIGTNIRVGCMIEVPSAALIADLLASECDFLSIGTNDLIQYCLAVDRENPSLSLHYTAAHPAIMRLLKQVTLAGKKHQIPVTVCGEMGSDPQYTTLLIGLGLRELSVSPRHLPRMKKAIRQIVLADAQALANHVLTLSTTDEILQYLEANKDAAKETALV